ncbi:WAP four-disulfide core domain protein 3 [Heterodontus francisci]|uniref:WAP four-disulfide core domain protein 3 n=1 Tax=Heterodontus francisci TaxID=7792 RepID=UPI00355C0879
MCFSLCVSAVSLGTASSLSDMGARSPYLLILTLSTLLLWIDSTSAFSSDKPGKCPQKPYGIAVCTEYCKDDRDCTGDMKCCSNGCGHVCRSPQKVSSDKPGKCPQKPRRVGSCGEHCTDDSDCKGKKKCCSNGCGHICISVQKAKPGKCPLKPRRVGLCGEYCTDDSDCKGNKKCCSNGCGHICISVQKDKPGKCPQKPRRVGSCGEYCTDDSDCKGNKKCCSNGCGHTCISVQKDKPGKCPQKPRRVGLCGEYCTDDSDCKGNKKCCSNGCGHTCISVQKDKPGKCPQKPRRVGLCGEYCTDDSDCKGNKKCCSNGCGHTCISVQKDKPGKCPQKPRRVGLCGEYCTDDSDCKGNKKCCSNGCGHTCISVQKGGACMTAVTTVESPLNDQRKKPKMAVRDGKKRPSYLTKAAWLEVAEEVCSRGFIQRDWIQCWNRMNDLLRTAKAKRTHNAREESWTGGGVLDIQTLTQAEEEIPELAATHVDRAFGDVELGLLGQCSESTIAAQDTSYTSEEETSSEEAASHGTASPSTSADTVTSGMLELQQQLWQYLVEIAQTIHSLGRTMGESIQAMTAALSQAIEHMVSDMGPSAPLSQAPAATTSEESSALMQDSASQLGPSRPRAHRGRSSKSSTAKGQSDQQPSSNQAASAEVAPRRSIRKHFQKTSAQQTATTRATHSSSYCRAPPDLFRQQKCIFSLLITCSMVALVAPWLALYLSSASLLSFLKGTACDSCPFSEKCGTEERQAVGCIIRQAWAETGYRRVKEQQEPTEMTQQSIERAQGSWMLHRRPSRQILRMQESGVVMAAADLCGDNYQERIKRDPCLGLPFTWRELGAAVAGVDLRGTIYLYVPVFEKRKGERKSNCGITGKHIEMVPTCIQSLAPCTMGKLIILAKPHADKPGKCPQKPRRVGLCGEYCTDDSDCKGNKKCCSNGCGHTCICVQKVISSYSFLPHVLIYLRGSYAIYVNYSMCLCVSAVSLGTASSLSDMGARSPYLLILTLSTLLLWIDSTSAKGHNSTVIKFGKCPRRLVVAVTKRGCTCDEDCPGTDKCCVFDCGAVCVPPAFNKPGICPQRYTGVGVCAEYCTDDSDCPGDEKCCSNGCGHDCTSPQKVKPGRCSLPRGTKMCAEFCHHDGDCPEEEKCCKTTCGHACSEPC